MNETSKVYHNHNTVIEGCPGCKSRFGTIVATTAEISAMLDSLGADNDPLTAALIQLVWTTNKNLDRIATALEGGAR